MEGHLRNLPAPILQATVPPMLSVSAVASADACRLKAVFQASPHEGALLQGPRAVLGSISHELVERAIRGIGKIGEAAFEELEWVLGALLEDARERLEGNPATAPYSDLPRTMSPLAWARKRRTILDLAYESAVRASPYGVALESRSHGGFRFEDLLRDGRWVEVPIRVPILRLKGRMDLLERKTDEIKIVDLKSGRVEDASGEVLPKIVLQLRLYGIMIQALDPKARVTLVVNDGTERTIAFDLDVAEETKSWLHSTMSSLAPGAIISAEELSKVGPDCRWCGIRHRCGGYLRKAPYLWTQEINWRLPLDTWGTVEQLNTKGNGLLDLTLLDAGGRRIKVFNVRENHLMECAIGKRVWLFDVAAYRSALSVKFWRHPLNFHEIDDSDGFNRAWSLKLFVEKM